MAIMSRITALAARRGRGGYDEYVEDRLPEEEDELGDEVSKMYVSIDSGSYDAS